MVEIRVPVERLRSVSDALDRQRQEINDLLQNLMTLMNGLEGEWLGLAQLDYAQMFNDQIPPIRTRSNELLEELSRALRHIADSFEETDQTTVDGATSGAVGAAGVGAAVGGVAAGVGGAVGGASGSAGSSGGGTQPPPAGAYQPRYDGTSPAPGMDSTFGKPGQVPFGTRGLPHPPVQSDPGNRSAGLYQDAINQFGVGNNPRYTADNYTYCNTFAGDVARAMGVPLPTKADYGINAQDQATIGFPQMWDYFTNPNAPVSAADQGWREVPKSDLGGLQNHVNAGKMALVVNNGHVAVVRPGQEIADFSSIRVAQAGAQNHNDISLGEGFGNSTEPKIFIID
jgi:WXG100 family type VII secretion target